MKKKAMQSAIARVDHLVYATPDLERTVEELTVRLGVGAAVGGRHPQWGTRNALIALGSSQYLEVMGPDPTSLRKEQPRPFGIDGLRQARLATWACKSNDIKKMVQIAKGVGVSLGTVQPGQRAKPDGTILTWTLTDLEADREGGVVPFFIDWGYSLHPAQGAPSGCALRKLWAEHPNPDRIREILEAFEIDLPIQYGEVFRLKALVETKNGLVELD
jgi:hypothetical protein